MKKKHWILLAILSLAFLLRAFNLADLFYFTHDEETVIWRLMPLLRDKDIFLLGGVTPMHIHLGPWFYYLTAFILSIGKLNLLSLGVASAVLGTLTCYFLYFVANKLFNTKVALIASFLYASSFLMVAFDRHWWPLVFNPLISLVVIYSLIQLVKKKWHFAIYLSLALSFGFHTDPSTWGLLILTGLVWLKYKLPFNKPPIKLGLLIFVLSFLPLIAFDINNQGQNILSFNKYLSETQSQLGLSFERFIWVLLYIPRSLSRLLYPVYSELAFSYAYCSQFALVRIQQASNLFTILVSTVLLWFLFKPSKYPQNWIIKAYFLSIIIGLNIYGNFFSSDIFDHYLATLFPLFLLILSIGLNKLAKLRGVILLLLSPLILINIFFFKNISNSQSFDQKQNAVTWTISQLKGKPFALDSKSDCFRYNGTRFLFTLQGVEPDLSFVDPNFFWLYKSRPQVKYPDTLVVFIDDPSLDFEYSDHILFRQKFGKTDVLIVDNSKKQFTIDF